MGAPCSHSSGELAGTGETFCAGHCPSPGPVGGLQLGGPPLPLHTCPAHIGGPSSARTEALIKRIKIKIRGFLIIKKRPQRRSGSFAFGNRKNGIIYCFLELNSCWRIFGTGSFFKNFPILLTVFCG